MSACMVTNTLTCLVPSCESMLYVMWDRYTILIIWNLWYRLQHVTPIQIAARVIEIIEDMEKQTPKLKAIVQHNKDEVLKVSEWEVKRQQGNREFFHVFNVLSKELASKGKSSSHSSFKLSNSCCCLLFRWHFYPLGGMPKENPCLLWMVFPLLWKKSLTW